MMSVRPRWPPAPRTPASRAEAPPMVPPTGIKYDTFADNVVRQGRRSLLRGSRIGRSLKSESPLSSKPVVTVYGPPLLLSRLSCALRFLSAWLDTVPRQRCRVSLDAGAHSASSDPVGDGMNAPSLLLNVRR